MEKHLFSNFLTNELEYNICKKYWETKIEYLLLKNKMKNFAPYLNTKYGNGEEQLDGNPIVNYYIKSKNKALRIIQEEPVSDNIEIGAWTNIFDEDDLGIIELVISLELTPESEKIAFDYIEKWLVFDYSIPVMDKYIDYIYSNLKSLQNSNIKGEISA